MFPKLGLALSASPAHASVYFFQMQTGPQHFTVDSFSVSASFPHAWANHVTCINSRVHLLRFYKRFS